MSDYLQVGQEVTVKVVEIDRQGRIRLTMKDLAPKQETEAESATCRRYFRRTRIISQGV